MESVERFKKQNRDLLMINNSGRHKQSASLFKEVGQLSEATVIPELEFLS